MASAPTTKLQAINTILSSVGESPITSLDYILESVSATIASNILDEVDRSFQSRGWSFNTDLASTFTRDASNYIYVASDVVRVNVSETTYPTLKVILRGNRLYDAKGKTYVFTSNIVGESVSFLDFSLIPEPARNFILIRSSRLFNIRTRPEEAVAKITEIDEQLAFSTFLEFEVRTGIDLNFLKYSAELDALGINQSVFLSSSADDKLKLLQTSVTNLSERQGRLYYQNRVEGKTTAPSDTFATYIEGFRRLGITEKDFLGLDLIQKEEALVIAKGATSSATTDTRASKFFGAGIADKARKLGIRYSEFCQLPNEAQQVFLDGVTSLTEDRFSRYVANQAKALKIGVRITDFLGIKPEEQELFLDTLASASYSDTRAETYVVQKAKLDKLGINAPAFFGLKPEEQANLLVAVADVSFTDTRVTSYVTNQAKLKSLGINPQEFFSLSYDQQSLVLDAVNSASYTETRASSYVTNQAKFKALGIYPADFFSLRVDQQNLILDAVNSGSYTETRSADYVTNKDKFRKLNITPVDFFSLKPDQQNLLISAVANASLDEVRATSYITNQAKLKKIGVYPAEFFSLRPDQQYLLLETLNSATWSDTRASDYFSNQDKFRKLGIEPAEYFSLKPEQQVLISENIASYTETRASSYITNQTKLKKIGVWPADFFSLKADQQNLLLEAITSASWSDTRSADYFTNQDKFRKLSIEPSDFFALKAEQQTLLLESIASYTETRTSSYVTNQTKLKSLGIYPAEFFSLKVDQQNLILEAVTNASYTETRATSYIANQAKLKKIGVWPSDFFALKIDQQNLLLDTLTSASWTDTRATDYVANQVKLKSIGVYPQDFFALRPEQQTLLLETIATFTEDRISRFNTASIQTNLRKLGVDLEKFLVLTKEQQNLLLDGASGLDNIIPSQATAIATFESINIYGKAVNQALRYLGIPPVSSFTTSDTAYTALKIIPEIDTLIQAEGWHYNTEKGIELTPDNNGNIIPNNSITYPVLGFDADKYEDFKHNIVLRGVYLYNVSKQTDVFTDKVKGDLVVKIDWNELPPIFQRYIVIRTAKELAGILGKPQYMQPLSLEESRARMEAIQYDSENGDYSMFDTYDVARVLDRYTGNSSIAY